MSFNTSPQFPALHSTVVAALSDRQLLVPDTDTSVSVQVRRHGKDGIAIEGMLDLQKVQGSKSDAASELRRLLNVAMARYSAHSRQELQDLLQEQYSGSALLESPTALVLTADSISAWWTLQKVVLLASKVTATATGLTIRYTTFPQPSTPSSAELVVHLAERWHLQPWAAPLAHLLLGRDNVKLVGSCTLATDSRGKVCRQVEQYSGVWGWGLWRPAKLVTGLLVPLWGTLVLGY